MRIIAGTARSMPLKTIEGTDTRPTTDRIKETLFNIIQMDVPGAGFPGSFCGKRGHRTGSSQPRRKEGGICRKQPQGGGLYPG